MKNTEPKLRTVSELSEYLGVSTCWIYRHVRELNAVRVGRMLRFGWQLDPKALAPPIENAGVLLFERDQMRRLRQRAVGFRRYQRGSVYRVPNGWRGIWREDVMTADGTVKRNKIHRTIGTIRELPTITAARKKLDEMIRGSVTKTELTFRELHGRWIQAVGPTLKKPTLMYYTHILDKHLLSAFGPVQITEISKYQVQLFLAGKAQNYSTPSLRGMRTALQKVLSWAVECDWLKINPCNRIKVPKSGKKRKRYVLTPQQVLLLASKLSKRDAVLVILLPAAGLRISEAIGLKWSDLRADGIHISRRVYEGDVDEVKTDESERIVPIGANVRTILLSLRESGDDGWIFHGRTGNPLVAKNVMRRQIKPVLKSLGLPNIGFHDFRHTLISWLGTARKSPKLIAEIVGHSDIVTTLRIYTHPSATEAQEALSDISKNLIVSLD